MNELTYNENIDLNFFFDYCLQIRIKMDDSF